MASRLIVLAAVLVTCQAKPVFFAVNGFAPEPVVFIREGRSHDFAQPSFAYGFGSGLSYDIGGIKHASSIGTSFSSGAGKAYGSGIAGSDGNAFASGIGYANANPAPQPIYRTSYPVAYSPYLRRDYGNSYAAAINRNPQPYGNYGSSIAQAQSINYGAAPIQNGGRFQSAVSFSENLGGRRNSFSAAHTNDGNGINSAVAASQNGGGISANAAQATQQQGTAVTQTGAFSFEGPGIKSAHSHVVSNYK